MANGRPRPTFGMYALGLAAEAATRSEDPYWQVGACLMRKDKTVAALGYNGAPPGVEIDWSDREGRRPLVLHAESNALRYVTPGEVDLVATTSMPCATCMLLIASYGVRKVLYRDELDPTTYDRALILKIAASCGIVVGRATARGVAL